MGTHIRDTLARTQLFAPIDTDGIDRMVDCGRVEHWNEGATVLEEGSSGLRMMVILEGRGEVFRRDPSGVERSIAQIGEGDVMGEMALLLDLPRTATVRAVTPLRVFTMDRTAYQEMVDAGDPASLRFSLEVSKVLAERLLRLNDIVADLLMHADGAEPLRERFTQARQEIFTLWEYDP